MVDWSCFESKKVIFYKNQSEQKYKFWQLPEKQANQTMYLEFENIFNPIKGVRPSSYATDVPDS